MQNVFHAKSLQIVSQHKLMRKSFVCSYEYNFICWINYLSPSWADATCNKCFDLVVFWSQGNTWLQRGISLALHLITNLVDDGCLNIDLDGTNLNRCRICLILCLLLSKSLLSFIVLTAFDVPSHIISNNLRFAHKFAHKDWWSGCSVTHYIK